MLDLIKKIAGILDELKIDYCITGGFAVSVWGRPRSTLDIDLIIQIEPEKASVFIKKIRSLSRAGYLDEIAVNEAILRGSEFNYIHGETGIKMDFWMIKKSDAIGRQEIENRKLKSINGKKIYFIAPEDLILSKLKWYKASGSDRHLDDIKSVLKFSKVDLKYLKQQASRQGILEILREVL